jgi:hypothetical protein
VAVMIDRTELPQLVKSLDAAELRRRIDELDGERAALITLLRAARARERKSANNTHQGGGTHHDD